MSVVIGSLKEVLTVIKWERLRLQGRRGRLLPNSVVDNYYDYHQKVEWDADLSYNEPWYTITNRHCSDEGRPEEPQHTIKKVNLASKSKSFFQKTTHPDLNCVSIMWPSAGRRSSGECRKTSHLGGGRSEIWCWSLTDGINLKLIITKPMLDIYQALDKGPGYSQVELIANAGSGKTALLTYILIRELAVGNGIIVDAQSKPEKRALLWRDRISQCLCSIRLYKGLCAYEPADDLDEMVSWLPIRVKDAAAFWQRAKQTGVIVTSGSWKIAKSWNCADLYGPGTRFALSDDEPIKRFIGSVQAPMLTLHTGPARNSTAHTQWFMGLQSAQSVGMIQDFCFQRFEGYDICPIIGRNSSCDSTASKTMERDSVDVLDDVRADGKRSSADFMSSRAIWDACGYDLRHAAICFYRHTASWLACPLGNLINLLPPGVAVPDLLSNPLVQTREMKWLSLKWISLIRLTYIAGLKPNNPYTFNLRASTRLMKQPVSALVADLVMTRLVRLDIKRLRDAAREDLTAYISGEFNPNHTVLAWARKQLLKNPMRVQIARDGGDSYEQILNFSAGGNELEDDLEKDDCLTDMRDWQKYYRSNLKIHNFISTTPGVYNIDLLAVVKKRAIGGPSESSEKSKLVFGVTVSVLPAPKDQIIVPGLDVLIIAKHNPHHTAICSRDIDIVACSPTLKHALLWDIQRNNLRSLCHRKPTDDSVWDRETVETLCAGSSTSWRSQIKQAVGSFFTSGENDEIYERVHKTNSGLIF